MFKGAKIYYTLYNRGSGTIIRAEITKNVNVTYNLFQGSICVRNVMGLLTGVCVTIPANVGGKRGKGDEKRDYNDDENEPDMNIVSNEALSDEPLAEDDIFEARKDIPCT